MWLSTLSTLNTTHILKKQQKQTSLHYGFVALQTNCSGDGTRCICIKKISLLANESNNTSKNSPPIDALFTSGPRAGASRGPHFSIFASDRLFRDNC